MEVVLAGIGTCYSNPAGPSRAMVASYSKCLEETLNGNLCLWPVHNSQQGYGVHFVSKNMI
jgi:hypothetical protein